MAGSGTTPPRVREGRQPTLPQRSLANRLGNKQRSLLRVSSGAADWLVWAHIIPEEELLKKTLLYSGELFLLKVFKSVIKHGR